MGDIAQNKFLKINRSGWYIDGVFLFEKKGREDFKEYNVERSNRGWDTNFWRVPDLFLEIMDVMREGEREGGGGSHIKSEEV